MKKLMFAAAVAAMSCGVFAEEAKTEAPAEKPAAVENARRARPQFDKAKFEERMKQRQAERKAAVVEILKKYGLDDEKAAACADELQKVGRPVRPPRPQRPRPAKKPAAAAPAEAPAQK